MQGTRVQSLVREDPISWEATKPVCHNYWACALEPGSHSERVVPTHCIYRKAHAAMKTQRSKKKKKQDRLVSTQRAGARLVLPRCWAEQWISSLGFLGLQMGRNCAFAGRIRASLHHPVLREKEGWVTHPLAQGSAHVLTPPQQGPDPPLPTAGSSCFQALHLPAPLPEHPLPARPPVPVRASSLGLSCTVSASGSVPIPLVDLCFWEGEVPQPSPVFLGFRHLLVISQINATPPRLSSNWEVLPFCSALLLCACTLYKWRAKSLSRVRLFVTPWTVAHQAPLSMGFPRQEYWSGFPFPSPGDSIRPRDQTWVSCISCIAGRFFTTEPGKPSMITRKELTRKSTCRSTHYSYKTRSCATLDKLLNFSVPEFPWLQNGIDMSPLYGCPEG